MSKKNKGFSGPIAAYNSLTDKHLAGYFSNTRIRRHLHRAGLITRNGRIVPDKEYRHNLIRKDHQKFVRECLAQAIFHKVLDMERHHQIDIKRKLEDFARKERVQRIKVERSKRYDEDIVPILSPRPPTGLRNGHTQHSGPDKEHSESSESPNSSRPNTAPGKMQRPVRLQPLHSHTPQASIRRPSPAYKHSSFSEDNEQHFHYTLDRDTGRHLTLTDLNSGISPYRLPVINNYITPVPPPTKRNERSFKGTPNGTTRGRRLRPTTAPNVFGATKDIKVHKTSAHSNVSITMIYCGKTVHLSHDNMDLRDEVKVFQQHCGGENLCVYKGKLLEGETFQFVSRRHCGFPFSLTFFLNGMQVDRLSSCCEFKHRKGSRLGGKHGHFGFVSVDGASPCYKCIIALGLDKKPTPPLKRIKEDTEKEGSIEGSVKMTEENREDDGEHIKEEHISADEASKEEAEGDEPMETETQEEMPKENEEKQEKPTDDYEEDFEGDDEKPDEEKEEMKSEASVVVAKSHSGSDDERDSNTCRTEDKETDLLDSDGDEKEGYTDSEFEEVEKSGNRKQSSVSSRSALFSSSSSKEESESEKEEVKEEVEDEEIKDSSHFTSSSEPRADSEAAQELEEQPQLDEELAGGDKEQDPPEEVIEAEEAGNTQAGAETPKSEEMGSKDAADQEGPKKGVEKKENDERDSTEPCRTEEDSLTQGKEENAGLPTKDNKTDALSEELSEGPGGDIELGRAKSVQKKLAEAIMNQASCSSEPEPSDSSTDEEEDTSIAEQTVDQGFSGVEVEDAIAFSLKQAAGIQEEKEDPMQTAEEEAGFKHEEKPETRDVLEPYSKAEDAEPETEGKDLETELETGEAQTEELGSEIKEAEEWAGDRGNGAEEMEDKVKEAEAIADNEETEAKDDKPEDTTTDIEQAEAENAMPETGTVTAQTEVETEHTAEEEETEGEVEDSEANLEQTADEIQAKAIEIEAEAENNAVGKEEMETNSVANETEAEEEWSDTEAEGPVMMAEGVDDSPAEGDTETEEDEEAQAEDAEAQTEALEDDPGQEEARAKQEQGEVGKDQEEPGAEAAEGKKEATLAEGEDDKVNTGSEAAGEEAEAGCEEELNESKAEDPECKPLEAGEDVKSDMSEEVTALPEESKDEDKESIAGVGETDKVNEIIEEGTEVKQGEQQQGVTDAVQEETETKTEAEDQAELEESYVTETDVQVQETADKQEETEAAAELTESEVKDSEIKTERLEAEAGENEAKDVTESREDQSEINTESEAPPEIEPPEIKAEESSITQVDSTAEVEEPEETATGETVKLEDAEAEPVAGETESSTNTQHPETGETRPEVTDAHMTEDKATEGGVNGVEQNEAEAKAEESEAKENLLEADGKTEEPGAEVGEGGGMADEAEVQAEPSELEQEESLNKEAENVTGPEDKRDNTAKEDEANKDEAGAGVKDLVGNETGESEAPDNDSEHQRKGNDDKIDPEPESEDAEKQDSGTQSRTEEVETEMCTEQAQLQSSTEPTDATEQDDFSAKAEEVEPKHDEEAGEEEEGGSKVVEDLHSQITERAPEAVASGAEEAESETKSAPPLARSEVETGEASFESEDETAVKEPGSDSESKAEVESVAEEEQVWTKTRGDPDLEAVTEELVIGSSPAKEDATEEAEPAKEKTEEQKTPEETAPEYLKDSNPTEPQNNKEDTTEAPDLGTVAVQADSDRKAADRMEQERETQLLPEQPLSLQDAETGQPPVNSLAASASDRNPHTA
nr:PREDICTED: glutamate-rich protein 3 isoform X1 [Lepisosteus oculatus]